VIAFGKKRGHGVVLSVPECVMLRRAYNTSDWSVLPKTGQLAAYLALAAIAGPEADMQDGPELQVDLWSILRSADARLLAQLKRQGRTVVFVERRREDRRA
jgi:hypothetical protein